MKVVGKLNVPAALNDLKKELKEVRSRNTTLARRNDHLQTTLTDSQKLMRNAEKDLIQTKERVEKQKKADAEILAIRDNTISRLEEEIRQLKWEGTENLRLRWERAEAKRIAESEQRFLNILNRRNEGMAR
jgi:predicted RNase H-like nuclease (RuvC/YqgF family)